MYRFNVAASATADIPRLVSFPQGIPAEIEDQKVAVLKYQKGAGKKRKTILAMECQGITYSGSDFGENSKKNDYCKFAVGVVDEVNSIINVYPVDHSFVMRPELKDHIEVEKNVDISYAERRQSLTDEFGSRKKKRAMHAMQSNKILAENIAGASAVENLMVNQLADTIGDNNTLIDAAEEALLKNRLQLLPKFDEAAVIVECAYPISGLVNRAAMKELEKLHDSIVTDVVPFADSIDTFKKTVISAYEGRLSAEKSAATVVGSLTNAFPLNLKWNASAPGKFSKAAEKRLKERFCLLLQLHFSVLFYRKISADRRMTIARALLDEALASAPFQTKKYLCDVFALVKNTSKESSISATKSLVDKLLLHIIVLALTLNDFSLNLDVLGQDLTLPVNNLANLARELGCKTTKQTRAASATDDQVGVTVASLTVPLTFPARKKPPTKR